MGGLELAFWATPGLPLFVANQGRSLIAQGETSVFYSVTVLTLFGHIPLAMMVGLLVAYKQWRSPEDAITVGAFLWLGLALASVALLVAHIITQLNGFLHALVVLSLVLGSLVRLIMVAGLPYVFLHNGDPFYMLVLWWLLLGVDWPYLTVQMSFFAELIFILFVAQLLFKSPHVGRFSATMCVLVAPIALHATMLSSQYWFLIVGSLPMVVAIMYMFYSKGSSIDFSRVLNFVDPGAFPVDDLDGVETKTK